MTSKLKTDVLETVSGSGTIALTNQLSGMTSASVPAGSVVQVVQSVLTSGVNINSASYVATGHTASITPTSSSNKILITLSGGACMMNNVGRELETIIYRDATALSNAISKHTSARDPMYTVHSITYLDSPATTSSITYQAYGKGAGVYYNTGGAVTLTLMEIKG